MANRSISVYLKQHKPHTVRAAERVEMNASVPLECSSTDAEWNEAREICNDETSKSLVVSFNHLDTPCHKQKPS